MASEVASDLGIPRYSTWPPTLLFMVDLVSGLVWAWEQDFQPHKMEKEKEEKEKEKEKEEKKRWRKA